jgi:hypothetical protein
MFVTHLVDAADKTRYLAKAAGPQSLRVRQTGRTCRWRP